jgi:peptidoglycan/LPS O-acetylase OafA/YrhL
MFFVLSGFVIAHAYKDRLGSWPGFRQFVLARLIRLYPVYIAATLFAAGEMLSYPWVGTGSHPEITAANVMKSLSTAVLLLPTPPRWSVEPTTFFPLLFPAWSLFWELSVNLI